MSLQSAYAGADGLLRSVKQPLLLAGAGRRWECVRTTLRNQWMLAGYHLGVSPQKLATRYRAIGR